MRVGKVTRSDGVRVDQYGLNVRLVFGSMYRVLSLGAAAKCEGFHCRGCEGEFISIWPQWEKPTDETFPHTPDCKYIAARALLRPAEGEGA